MVNQSLLRTTLTLATIFLATAPGGFAAAQQQGPEQIVATVNGQPITINEFNANFARAARQSFYHGRASEEKLAALKDDVMDELILERLLLDEARRRGIAGDIQDVEARVKAYDEQYRDSKEWIAQRDRTIPLLRERMLQNTQRRNLEAAVRTVEAPAEAELEAFYAANLQSFTEPARDRVALLLLTVDPSSPKAAWDAAKEEAQRLRQRILDGASFAELAKLHSADESAANGGDMGYLHRGMLSDDAQAAVDGMQPGDLSEPVLLLQGYALFRLVERTPAKVRSLPEVRQRALDLYLRHHGDQRWADLLKSLREPATIWIDANLTAEMGSDRR